MDDVARDAGSSQGPVGGKGAKRLHADDRGESRSFLRVFETMPVQWLNAYGQALYTELSDKDVWDDMCKKLKSGAMWNSEYCAKEVERHGTAFNRFLQSLLEWMRYQEEPKNKLHNEAILQPGMCQKLYAEIALVKASVEYLLAPRKEKAKAGAARLRSSRTSRTELVPQSQKDPAELDRHCKIVYDELLSPEKPSKIRLIMHWQSGGGVSFVAGCHYRGTVCFMKYGLDGGAVSLEHLQKAVKVRHESGNDGTEDDGYRRPATPMQQDIDLRA